MDPHIPKRRVEESAVVFGRMGAAVTKRIYPGLGHTINADEIAMVRAMVEMIITEFSRRAPQP